MQQHAELTCRGNKIGNSGKHCVKGITTWKTKTGDISEKNPRPGIADLDINLSGPGQAPILTTARLSTGSAMPLHEGLTTPNVSVDPLVPPIIEPYDLYTLSVMPSLEKPNTLPPLDAETSTAFVAAASGMDSIAQQSVALVALADSELATFLVASDHFAVNGAAAASVAAYYTSPRVIMFEGGVSSGSSSNLTFGFDLVHDSISAIAYPGQAQYATISFNMARGHVDSALESVAFPAVPGVTFMSSHTGSYSRPSRLAYPLSPSTVPMLRSSARLTFPRKQRHGSRCPLRMVLPCSCRRLALRLMALR